MILSAFTRFHVALSLAGIASGFVVLSAMRRGRPAAAATAWFLWTTIATRVTGFLFPFHQVLPAASALGPRVRKGDGR